MAAGQIFAICNFVVLPGWLLLVVAPRWRWTQRVAGLALPLALAAVYLTLLIVYFRKGEGGFGSPGWGLETLREPVPAAGRLDPLPGFRSFHRVVAGARFRAPANRARFRGSMPAADISVRSSGIADLVLDPDVAARAVGGDMKDKTLRALRELYQSNPVLTITGWFHWILAGVLILAAQFDSRTILGINPWIKPIKFSISIAIYVWTLAWFLRYLSGRKREVRMVSWIVATTMVAEILGITLQSARGVPSHFNVATPLDTALFSGMGAMIGLNTGMLIWVCVLFFVDHPDLPAAYLWGIRFGLLLFVLASFEGVFMVIHGSHTVGAADGGAGLPFVNWSRQHGDLRVAHFAGMHALQVLPLVGYWIGRTRRPEAAQVSYVAGLFFLYLAGMALLFGMAWQGRPLAL
jgi:hypothetical protein